VLINDVEKIDMACFNYYPRIFLKELRTITKILNNDICLPILDISMRPEYKTGVLITVLQHLIKWMLEE
jgi:hypothetical protein